MTRDAPPSPDGARTDDDRTELDDERSAEPDDEHSVERDGERSAELDDERSAELDNEHSVEPDNEHSAERDGERSVESSGERLLLDAMLGKLATYLRMCGHDAAYALDRGVEADDKLRALAAEEGRTLITRDEALAARTPDARLVTERAVTGQLRELHAAGVDLRLAERPARCGRCNGSVESMADATARRPEYVPSDVRAWRCLDCDQWFWKGSHWDRVADTLGEVRADARSTPTDSL